MIPDNYTITRRNVKNARLRVSEDGKVYLFVPLTFTDEDIEDLLERKRFWIVSKQNYFKQRSKILLRRNEILLFGNRYAYYYSTKYKSKIVINHETKTIQASRDLLNIDIQEKWLKTVARKYVLERIDALSKSLMLPYSRLFIRSQKKKWGNCSKEKNISINWRIIKAPKFVIDYVIIHELCHTVIMNHSIKFTVFLNSVCPNYKEAHNWLDTYGSGL